MTTTENRSDQSQRMSNQTEQTQLQLGSYSSALKLKNQEIFPKKEQGILLNVIEELKLSDYVIKVGSIVGPRNILFASRISNNRICIYLSDIQLVDKIVEEHSIIVINDREIEIRRLITPARRIVISNVCPSIPHHIIENELRQLGIKTVSPVSCIRAGITGDEYSHVMSFRRQVYTIPTQSEELPSSILIDHENTKYRIYLSDDNLKCYICKAPGHIARQCPSQNTRQTPTVISSITIDKPDQIPNQTIEPIIDISPVESITEHLAENLINEPNIQDNIWLAAASTSKRPAETISTPTKTPSEELLMQLDNLDETQVTRIILGDLQKKPQKSNKKMRKSDSTESLPKLKISMSTESLTSIKESIQPIELPLKEKKILSDLNFDQIADFIENAYGCKDPLSLARQYSENIPGVLQLLEDMQPYLTNRNMKNRCTKLGKRIDRLLKTEQENESRTSSESSQISSY